VQLLSDMVIRAASLFYAEAAAARSPVWLYRQDLRTAAMRAIGLGATHTSDLPLLFGNLRAGVGQVMCALPGDLRAARAVSRELQADVTRFMREGALPWPRAYAEGLVAKCYDVVAHYEAPVPQAIYAQYQRTTHYALGIA